MPGLNRRTFLKLSGIPAAAALPIDFTKACSIPANDRTKSIDDVEHVIILMQENRAFDHYFGTLRGVRGFADPHPVRLSSGKPVWNQPNGAGELLPFRPNVPDIGRTFLPDPPHGWNDTHAAWNEGRYDQWVPNKGVQTMTYHTRKDLPYPYALADAFTICDNYHCSLLGPTDPNRYHMWTGWVGNDGKGGGPVVTNAEAGYDWSTYPERLQRNGIDWKVYQDIGNGLDAAGYWGWTSDPFIGNYGDNSLLYFHQYQNAAPGTPLADRAKTGTEVKSQGRSPDALLADFRADVQNDRLPQVSWIVAPEAYTEHPNWEPDYGTWYVSQVIDILANNPAVWGKMALFIMYDEEGGFFDHLVPPTPPMTPLQGKSTVPTTNEIYPGGGSNPPGPYGLGVRVPMIVVSPWTRGGWVNSQLFDHTSLIRFLERRFGKGNPDLIESNITPWRRAVVGDLTSAFNFRSPNSSRQFSLPDTDSYKPTDLTRHPDQVPVPPAQQGLPARETGVRPARALPYSLIADGHAVPGGFAIDFRNIGDATAVFQVYTAGNLLPPRNFTVEPGKQLSDTWVLPAGYDLTVYGPNGFYRAFKGGPIGTDVDVSTRYERRGDAISLTFVNRGSKRVTVGVADRYGNRSKSLTLKPDRAVTEDWQLGRSKGWYGLVVTSSDDKAFLREIAGHVEDGNDSISDPLMGGLV